jgi:hypothetical protein
MTLVFLLTLLFLTAENGFIESVSDNNEEFNLANETISVKEDSLRQVPVQIEKKNPAMLKTLHQEITNISYIPDYLNAPVYLFSQNFHLSVLFSEPFWLEKNDFLLTSLHAEDYFQLYAPFYTRSFSDFMCKMHSSTYHEQVSLSKTYLSLGAANMNHAFVSFRKGNIWQNVTAEFAFLTHEGIWHGENDTAKIYHSNAFYPSKWGNWRFSATVIEEAKLANDEKIKGYDADLIWQNRFFHVGYRFEFLNRETKISEKQIFLQKDTMIKNHYFLAKIVYTDNQKKSFYYQAQTKSLLSIAEIQNDAVWRNKHEYSWQTKWIWERWNNLEFHTLQKKYLTEQNKLFYPTFSIGLTGYLNKYISQKIAFERIFYQGYKSNALNILNQFELPFSAWQFRFENQVRVVTDKNTELPAWLLKQSCSLTFYLQHNNQIQLGLSHFNSGEFRHQQMEKNSLNVVNAYLLIQISKLFEIQFSGINLLSQSYEPYNPYENAHLTVGLKWIFIN